jgi:hypothetical protein
VKEREMEPTSMDVRRLETLEKELRRLRRVVPVLGIGFALLLLWQLVPGPETIEARQFLVRDQKGIPRIVMTMWDGDRPTLRLNDEAGRARAMWFLYPGRGGSLRFTDTTGHHRIQLVFSPEGNTEFWMGSEEGRTRTWLGTATAGSPGIVFNDAYSQWLWAAPPSGGR